MSGMIDITEVNKHLKKSQIRGVYREQILEILPRLGNQQFTPSHLTWILRDNYTERTQVEWATTSGMVRRYIPEFVERGLLEEIEPPKKGRQGVYRVAQVQKAMSLEDEFTDGPYEGEQLEDVIEDRPDYVRSLVDLNQTTFDDRAQQVLRQRGLC